VHQDGTCNGLQHYAALGGDVIGARQVNLDVTDKPSDVYTYVSDMVKAVIERDAAAGDEIAQKLRGRVNRKVVKQTVCHLKLSRISLLLTELRLRL
jgi:DNA-directed RNA polymerase, mitochondrial